jgi:hypothetical protein
MPAITTAEISALAGGADLDPMDAFLVGRAVAYRTAGGHESDIRHYVNAPATAAEVAGILRLLGYAWCPEDAAEQHWTNVHYRECRLGSGHWGDCLPW